MLKGVHSELGVGGILLMVTVVSFYVGTINDQPIFTISKT